VRLQPLGHLSGGRGYDGVAPRLQPGLPPAWPDAPAHANFGAKPGSLARKLARSMAKLGETFFERRARDGTKSWG
jgi:hypothetical protein